MEVLPHLLAVSAHCLTHALTHTHSFIHSFFFFKLLPPPAFLTTSCSMWNFPNQGSNLCPLKWKHGVSSTGPPGKSVLYFLIHLFLRAGL